MVRETRLSWDDSLSLEMPEQRDRFDELDDEFLEVFAPEKPRAPKPAGLEHRKRHRPAATGEPRRHLAGADWLRDEGQPPRHP